MWISINVSLQHGWLQQCCMCACPRQRERRGSYCISFNTGYSLHESKVLRPFSISTLIHTHRDNHIKTHRLTPMFEMKVSYKCGKGKYGVIRQCLLRKGSLKTKKGTRWEKETEINKKDKCKGSSSPFQRYKPQGDEACVIFCFCVSMCQTVSTVQMAFHLCRGHSDYTNQTM